MQTLHSIEARDAQARIVLFLKYLAEGVTEDSGNGLKRGDRVKTSRVQQRQRLVKALQEVGLREIRADDDGCAITIR